jgi:hypothetical protein
VLRTLFHLLAGASLLLCVATFALWSRSNRQSDLIFLGDGHHCFCTLPGRIWIGISKNPDWIGGRYESGPVTDAHDSSGPFLGFARRTIPGGARYETIGFVYEHFSYPARPLPRDFLCIAVPLWFPTVLTAVVPLLWLNRRCAPRTPGICHVCGYDLRATPERCPECGTAVLSAATSRHDGNSSVVALSHLPIAGG